MLIISIFWELKKLKEELELITDKRIILVKADIQKDNEINEF